MTPTIESETAEFYFSKFVELFSYAYFLKIDYLK